MSRFANGATPTGEYQARREYDAGYRDGYRAARERCESETALLRQRLETLAEMMAAAAAVSPSPSFTITAEQAKQLNVRIPNES